MGTVELGALGASVEITGAPTVGLAFVTEVVFVGLGGRGRGRGRRMADREGELVHVGLELGGVQVGQGRGPREGGRHFSVQLRVPGNVPVTLTIARAKGAH